MNPNEIPTPRTKKAWEGYSHIDGCIPDQKQSRYNTSLDLEKELHLANQQVEELNKVSNHNKRMWEGQINRTKLAEQQITKLEAACAEKDEAIEGILHLWNGHEEKCDEKGCAICELKNALNSSTCGQGMLEDSKMLDWLEENRSNSKIEYIYSPEHKVCISLYKDGVWWHRAFGSTLREAIKAAMSTHQTTKEK